MAHPRSLPSRTRRPTADCSAEKAPRQRPVDDRHRRRRPRGRALSNGRPSTIGIRIVSRYRGLAMRNDDRRLAPGLGRRSAVDGEPRPAIVGAERQHVDESGRARRPAAARCARSPARRTAAAAVALGVAVVGQRQRHGEHAAGIKARIDVLQAAVAAHEQSRADEQERRQRDLGDDEPRAQPAGAAAAAGRRGFLQAVLKVLARRRATPGSSPNTTLVRSEMASV